jgi:hypothetical protein
MFQAQANRPVTPPHLSSFQSETNQDHAARLAAVEQKLAALTINAQATTTATHAASRAHHAPLAVAGQATVASSTLGPDATASSPPYQQMPLPHVSSEVLLPMSDRITLTPPIPLVDYKEPFLTLRQWDTWHEQVTDRAYKNAQSTHAAIPTLRSPH